MTDVVGPRLTGSHGMRRVNEWTRDRLESCGLSNVRLEPWGTFGRGWSLKRFSTRLAEPRRIPLIAYPKAWSPGTGGPIIAPVVHPDIHKAPDIDKYHDDPTAHSTLAEVPDADLKDELVMLGGHLDSWHSDTGATDNGAGVADCMVAVRILQAANLKPKTNRAHRALEQRGTRLARFQSLRQAASRQPTRPGFRRGRLRRLLWRQDRAPAPHHARIRQNLRLLQPRQRHGTDSRRLTRKQRSRPPDLPPLAPAFPRPRGRTLTTSRTFGIDHQPFDAISIPAFQFIQDPIEYGTRTHHSNQDLRDRIQGDDLKQAAVIMASFLYQTALSDEPLPRKPPPPH